MMRIIIPNELLDGLRGVVVGESTSNVEGILLEFEDDGTMRTISKNLQTSVKGKCTINIELPTIEKFPADDEGLE
jgi:hypothetical protein